MFSSYFSSSACQWHLLSLTFPDGNRVEVCKIRHTTATPAVLILGWVERVLKVGVGSNSGINRDPQSWFTAVSWNDSEDKLRRCHAIAAVVHKCDLQNPVVRRGAIINDILYSSKHVDTCGEKYSRFISFSSSKSKKVQFMKCTPVSTENNQVIILYNTIHSNEKLKKSYFFAINVTL